jgi:hypothetical protein
MDNIEEEDIRKLGLRTKEQKETERTCALLPVNYCVRWRALRSKLFAADTDTEP